MLNASSFRFAIVASRWNDAIVSRLIDGAQKALQQASAADDAVELFRVPGAFEIPLCAQKAAESRKFDAVICLGVRRTASLRKTMAARLHSWT